ncbi:MAG: alginate export family protein [Bacteroidales bacterium]|nr:alginate export family protein [Bacteroidales bacterium]
MKNGVIKFVLVAIIVTGSLQLYSQRTEISGQFRPRYEYRHGYKTLAPDDASAANFISQRTRLNLKYADDWFKIGLSLQNVGVWGETGTLSSSDVNGIALHEAWGEILFSKKFSLKAGRQEIIYDDHRIFGSVDWAQQGRSHDAAIVTFKPKDDCRFDLGFAYNSNMESNFKEYYFTSEYKTFQYIHWHRGFGDFGISVLILNNGLPWINFSDTTGAKKPPEKIAYSQTLGTRLTYKKNKISANGAFYLQTGKISADTTKDGKMESTRDLSGLYFSANFTYQVCTKFSAGAGFEYLSGNSMKDPSKTDEAFKPLYGTNHKFNGWMDYFYVGSHMQSVGLLDFYVPLTFKADKFTATITPHFFQSAGELVGKDENGALVGYDKNLGTEVDLSLGYAISPSATIKAGYSQMFATSSMELLKGGNSENTNNWAWVMIDLTPTFFKSEK